MLEVDGRRLLFRVEAWDQVEKVCEGTHERFMIDPVRFTEKMGRKAVRARALAADK